MSDHDPVNLLIQLGQKPSFIGIQEHNAPHARAVHMATDLEREVAGCENWQQLSELHKFIASTTNSNSSKLLWLSLLCARIKIHPKMKALEWSQHFSHNKSMGIFSDAQGQLNSAVPGQILINFEPI